MTPDCKTSTNDNINPHLSSFRARDCNCYGDWSPQVRHVEETACLSPPRKLSLFASDRGNVWLSIYVALWALEMSPLYFPNVHREALWSSRAGGCQLSVRKDYSLSWLISLKGNFNEFFNHASKLVIFPVRLPRKPGLKPNEWYLMQIWLLNLILLSSFHSQTMQCLSFTPTNALVS